MSNPGLQSQDDEDTVDEDTVDEWEHRLEDATTADNVTPRTLAELVGDVDKVYIAELWNHTYSRVVDDARSKFTLDDFQAVHKELQDGPLGDDDLDEHGQDDAEERVDDEITHLESEVQAEQETTQELDGNAAYRMASKRNTEDLEHQVSAGVDVDDNAIDESELSALGRDDLEAKYMELRERVADLEDHTAKLQEIANKDVALIKGVLNRLLANLESFDAFPEAAESLREALDEYDGRIEDIDRRIENLYDVMNKGEQSSKEAKIHQIVRCAENLRENDQPLVRLTARDIISATGVSERYAYKLLDQLPDERNWIIADDEIRQYGDIEIDSNQQVRSIGIDFEGVQSTGYPLKEFNNGSG